jgi:hypothetical protein
MPRAVPAHDSVPFTYRGRGLHRPTQIRSGPIPSLPWAPSLACSPYPILPPLDPTAIGHRPSSMAHHPTAIGHPSVESGARSTPYTATGVWDATCCTCVNAPSASSMEITRTSPPGCPVRSTCGRAHRPCCMPVVGFRSGGFGVLAAWCARVRAPRHASVRS